MSGTSATGPRIKRKRSSSVKTSRRALSCTECKRRKTKCGTIGKVPCDSCLRRGKPADCRWDGLENEPALNPSAEPDTEVSALREQIDRLEKIIDSFEFRQSGRPQARANASHDPPPDNSNNLENAADDLERRVFGPGIRPGVVDTTTTTPRNVSSTPKTTSAFPLSSLLGSSSHVTALLDVLPSLLPNSPFAKDLVEDFFVGPIHRAWHVIFRTAFMPQFREYSELNLEQFESKIDPIWFALYLMVLALSIKFPQAHGPTLQGFLAVRAGDLPSVLQRASVTALGVSDYLINPQIGHIQVSILYVVFLFAALPSADLHGRDYLSPTRFMTIAIYSFAGAIRRGSQPSDFDNRNNSDVLAYDRTLQEVLKLIPVLPNNKDSCIHNRILRVHRPYMLKGYSDSTWATYTVASVLSAKQIVKIQHGLLPWADLRPGFVDRWVMGAAIVFAIAGFAGDPTSLEHLLLAREICAGTDGNMSRAIQAMIGALNNCPPDSFAKPLSEISVQRYFNDVNRLLVLSDCNDSGLPGAPLAPDFGGFVGLDAALFSFDQPSPYTGNATESTLADWGAFDWTMI
ncbi:hypothetical protein IAT40_001149 [Kwoniella sp. CBS 6097]